MVRNTPIGYRFAISRALPLSFDVLVTQPPKLVCKLFPCAGRVHVTVRTDYVFRPAMFNSSWRSFCLCRDSLQATFSLLISSWISAVWICFSNSHTFRAAVEAHWELWDIRQGHLLGNFEFQLLSCYQFLMHCKFGVKMCISVTGYCCSRTPELPRAEIA